MNYYDENLYPHSGGCAVNEGDPHWATEIGLHLDRLDDLLDLLRDSDPLKYQAVLEVIRRNVEERESLLRDYIQ